MPLRIAIVHYHLRPGGVTRVIENAVRAISQTSNYETIVISGEPRHKDVSVTPRLIGGLRYSCQPSQYTPHELVDSLHETANSAFGTPPDIWHFHNHGLGKNCLLADVVNRLAIGKQRLLLQIHDFAEDGRAAEYANIPVKSALYPLRPRVHFAALNQRDLAFLQKAGIEPSRLHLLPNPVRSSSEAPTPHPSDRPLIFYPARGIRRKNLGEILLLAMLSPKEVRWASAAIPDNPRWSPIHERWEHLARHFNLPVWLGVAERFSPSQLGINDDERQDFSAWMENATHIVSTSIAEGFGLAFLEPYALGKPLLGRNLPQITTDFTDAGASFTHLYHHLTVPLHWVGEIEIRFELVSALMRTYSHYKRAFPPNAVGRAFQSMQPSPGRIDFGSLNESMQEMVLKKLHRDPAAKEEVFAEFPGHTVPASEWLETELDHSSAMTVNREVIERHYSLDAYGHRLRSVYESMMQPDSLPFGNSPKCAERVLDQFLSPERFHLLRA